ncbi:MAG: tryptophan synthase subunit alpha [Candidatus Methanosuratus sp.]|nr:tryptophan synthase subunit alpha [Candidatus Methanosuratincola sp.]
MISYSDTLKISSKFDELKKRGEGAYMAHVYYGDPNEEFSIRLIRTLAENGADLIEFGIPFSDPTADGPAFQAACERSLRGGMTPKRCIEGLERLRREGLKAPVVVTTYYNIPYSMGLERFMAEIKEAGAQAVIVPDLSFEEADELVRAGGKQGLDVIFQIAPTTEGARLNRIIDAASGFLYVINVEGVTGTKKELQRSTLELIRGVRSRTGIPLMAGFGVSKKEHVVDLVSSGADGVVTGSAIAEIYSRKLDGPEDALPEIARFAREIKAGCVEGFARRSLNR